MKKEAVTASQISKAQKEMLAPLAGFGKGMLAAATIPLMAGAVQYFFARKNIKEELEGLKDSYKRALEISPKMSENPDKAALVFRELCTVAPVVAANPQMAAKVIEPRLNTGLTVDDIHKLTMINSHAPKAVFSKTPGTEAARTAGLVTDKMFMTFGPRALDSLLGAAQKSQKIYQHYDAQFRSGGGSMNKQSSQRVSDECLGEMLADRYVLLKNSPLVKEAAGGMGSMLSKGVEAAGRGAAFMLAPLAIAGAIHGIGALIDAKKKNEFERQANDAFKKIQSQSDVIQENKALAAEAFDAIKTFAPSLAAKPAILKTFIEHAISTQGRIPPEMVNSLAVAEANAAKTHTPGFAQGFIGGATPVINMSKAIVEAGKTNKKRG